MMGPKTVNVLWCLPSTGHSKRGRGDNSMFLSNESKSLESENQNRSKHDEELLYLQLCSVLLNSSYSTLYYMQFF